MVDNYLIPEGTVMKANGDGEAVAIGGAQNRVFLLGLKIAEVVEQESLDVSIYASVDGQAWEAKPVMKFPQHFYAGESPMLLDLTGRPEVKWVRAHWEVARWGRGSEQPRFVASLRVREVSREVLGTRD